MKKTFLSLIALFFCATFLAAQSSTMIIRAKSGGKFWLVVDDLRKNLDPESQVSVVGLEGYKHQVKVTFEKASLGTMEIEIYVNPATEMHYILRPSGPQADGSSEVVLLDNGKVAMAVEEMIVLDPAAFSTQVTPKPDVTLLSDDVGAIGQDIKPGEDSLATDTPISSTTIKEPEPIVYVEGYEGKIGCDLPMNSTEFSNAIESIKSKSYDNTRVTLAKQITRANCLTVDQVKTVIETFSYENNKLDYAKFAFPYTYDQGNYSQLNGTFGFSSSIDKLKEYLETVNK